MIKTLNQWTSCEPRENGVIVGCARNHEWLLPWWWMNYRKHNDFPVTFFDFGDLSEKAIHWCEGKGQLIKLPTIESYITQKKDIDPDLIKSWESNQDLDPWKARIEWFKKPFACLRTPYLNTIWFDLDCQIFKSIAPIFELIHEKNSIALAEEPPLIKYIHEFENVLKPGETEYNTGVIAFKHGASIIPAWAEKCLEANADLRGDQEVLSLLIYERNFKIKILPPIYNWRGDTPTNEGFMDFLAVIHWLGECKIAIKLQIEQFKENGNDLSL